MCVSDSPTHFEIEGQHWVPENGSLIRAEVIDPDLHRFPSWMETLVLPPPPLVLARGGRVSAPSPARCAHIMHWLRVLDECCRSNSTICLPFAVYVRIGADSRAAMRVCVAGGGALALRDLSIGRVFSPTEHPMAVGLGPIDSRLAELVVRKSGMIVITFLFTLSFTAVVCAMLGELRALERASGCVRVP